MVNKNAIPLELRDTPQWVCWKWGLKPNGEKTKVPVRAIDGGPASSTNPEDWTSFLNAYNAWRAGGGIAGVGFVFTEEAGYVGVDFDDCVTEIHGPPFRSIRATEEAYLEMLNSYAEVSPSGKGFKVIFKGQIPDDFARRGFGSGNGIYQHGRFFTITGQALPGYDTIREVEPETLRTFLTAVFPAQQRGTQEWEEADERLTDIEVTRIAAHSANGDKFMDLWRGDYEGAGYDSNSEADAALVEMLAFYCGRVPTQIDRLFRQSGLFRDKWDSQRGSVTYGERTIDYVLGHMDTFYSVREDEMPKYPAETETMDAADVPLPAPRREAKKAWRRMMENFPPLGRSEMPEYLRRLVEHIEPLGRSFQAGGQEDWLITSTLGFWSGLFEGIHFENLPLNLWTLSIGEQGTGKSVVADELDAIIHAANHEYGLSAPLGRYSSGSASGLMRRLDGRKQKVLAYFSEWSGFAKNMESDHSSNMREVLMDLYDGRNIYHQLAQEAIDIRSPHLCLNAVTTQSSWAETADARDAINGLYSRFLFCMPDYRRVGFKFRNTRQRQELIADLVSHLRTLSDETSYKFDRVEFKAGEEGPECYQKYRRETLGLDADENEVIDADDALLRTDDENVPGGRPAARVKRVAALLELMEKKPWVYGGTLYVRDENVEKAIRIVQRGVAYAVRAYNLLSRSRDEMEAARVRRALDTFGTLSVYGLLRATGLNRAEVERACDTLAEEGLVASRIDNGKRIYFGRKE